MAKKSKFLFETSWEVCNKVGGIHTVITSKLPTIYKEFGDDIIFIGPDLLKSDFNHPEFIEDKSLFVEWRKDLNCDGIRVRAGRWDVMHKPKVLLIDFTPLIPKKDDIFKNLWETYKVDSLSGSWDYIESTLFGYAVGEVVKSFSDFYLSNKQVLAQFHEWMTGAGVLYIEQFAPYIGTIFTTHATVLGRSIAGNGIPLYQNLGNFDPDQKAKELGVISKHSVEKMAAKYADTFTTVSNVTGNECEHLLQNKPDFITPNGFALEHLEPITDKTQKKSREALCRVTKALTGLECDENTLFAATSGRYEFKNKGIDIFLDTLAKLNHNSELKHNVVGFILVPTENYGAEKTLLSNLESGTFTQPEHPITTHSLNPNSYDPIIDKCNQLGLLNRADQKVKIIFAPVYLNGSDGVFNISYYNLLSGFDISAFPSYYEPWGYTPMESLAVGVPTITTSYSGFGQWMHTKSENISHGLSVVKRTEENYWDVVNEIESIFLQISNTDLAQRKNIRKSSVKLASETVWDEFATFYLNAYEKA